MSYSSKVSGSELRESNQSCSQPVSRQCIHIRVGAIKLCMLAVLLISITLLWTGWLWLCDSTFRGLGMLSFSLHRERMLEFKSSTVDLFSEVKISRLYRSFESENNSATTLSGTGALAPRDHPSETGTNRHVTFCAKYSIPPLSELSA